VRVSRATYDVAVVGAGPAGSATAALLADRGLHVVLLERAAFPRDKACAEYVSPEALRILDRLGVLGSIRAEAALLSGMTVVSHRGTAFTGRFRGSHGFRGYSDVGIGIRRTVLDARLAHAAVAKGAELRERTLVETMSTDGNGVRELQVRSAGRRERLAARLVVAADGLKSRIARQLRLSRSGRLRRLALVTHATDVDGMGDVGEMHVGRVGYLGLAPVGLGVTNVAVVVDLARVGAPAPAERWLHALISRFPSVAHRLRGATFHGPVIAAGPFAHHTVRATADRVMLVGDAADFYDPFTGEGVYAALRGSELVLETARDRLADDRLSADALAAYDRKRRSEFGRKWTVERMIAWAVGHPPAFEHVAGRLARRPGLADLLVGVTGDFVPPREVLRPSFMFRLVW
jgi:geranylgeranyl reductase family protein